MSGMFQVLKPKRIIPKDLDYIFITAILSWLLVSLVILYIPSVAQYLEFIDGFVFDGVVAHAHCPGGDATVNARALMISWVLSLALLLITFFLIRESVVFYRYVKGEKDGLMEAKAFSRSPFVSSIIFNSVLIFILVFAPFYYIIDSEVGCLSRYVDGVVFVQGMQIIAWGGITSLVIKYLLGKYLFIKRNL